MGRRDRIRMILVPATAIALVRLAACGDQGWISAPAGGGVQNQNVPCSAGAAPDDNNNWSRAGLNGEILIPESGSSKCPYRVYQERELISIAVKLKGPKVNLPNNGVNQFGNFEGLYSWYPDVLGAPRPTMAGRECDWITDPTVVDGSTAKCEVANLFSAAMYGFNPDGTPNSKAFPRDTGRFSTATLYGLAVGHIEVTGTAQVALNQIPGSIVGLPTVNTGASQTWRAMTQVDTNSYSFGWLVDGDTVANDDALFTHTFELPGNHQLAALARMADDSVERLDLSVYSRFVANIAGPTTVAAYSAATWSASIPGGFPPYIYLWKVDGSTVSTSSSYSHAFGPSQTHWLSLGVSDSHGFSSLDSIRITSSSGGTCRLPPCP